MEFLNGTAWTDTDGNAIHAHGGHILEADGFYYWYGENRTDGNFVSVYRTKDFKSWDFCRHVLTVRSACAAVRHRTDLELSKNGKKVNLERPKVLYNELTKKYVMWLHYENEKDYMCASAAVASCDTPDGDFTYHGSFRPYGNDSRDCTLFKEEDGSAYFISAARDNADLNIYKLSDDYLNLSRFIGSNFPGEYREAPAVFKKEGVYYMLTSFCTGWEPNQGAYATASSMEGEWSSLKKFGDATTFDSQPAFVFQDKRGDYIYIGDRWGGQKQAEFDYFKSNYVWLRLDVCGGDVKMAYSEKAYIPRVK